MRLLHPGPHRRSARSCSSNAEQPGRSAARRTTHRGANPGGTGRKPVPLHRIREDHRGGPHRDRRAARRTRAGGRPMSEPTDTVPPILGSSRTLIIEGCAIATVDSDGTEYPTGHVIATHGVIRAIGPGPAPREAKLGGPGRGPAPRVIDGSGCLLTPGLINTHHHLYQWIFRGLAQDSTLFDWLTHLYPRWARIDE